MRRILLVVIILSVCMAPTALAEVVTCLELIENAKTFDGSKVSVTGEVIGDILRRGDNVWINVNDGTCALGAWIEKSKVETLDLVPGRYDGIGTVVGLSGTFNRACAQHSGETDIHVDEIELVETAKPVEHTIQNRMVIGAAVALLMAFALTVLAAGRTRMTGKVKSPAER